MGGTLNSLQKRCIRLQVSLQAVPQFDVSVRDNWGALNQPFYFLIHAVSLNMIDKESLRIIIFLWREAGCGWRFYTRRIICISDHLCLDKSNNQTW